MRRRRALGASAVLALVVGSVVAVDAWRGRPQLVRLDDGITVLVADVEPVDDASLLQGTLANVDGCLGVRRDRTDPGTVIIWPVGTSVVSTDPVRLAFRGQNYGFGDDMALGGGAVADGLAAAGSFDADAPAGCRDLPVWTAR